MVELQLPFPSMGIIDLVSLLNVSGDEVKNFDSVKIRFARDFAAFWGHTTDFSFVLTRFDPKQIIGTVAYFTTKIRQRIKVIDRGTERATLFSFYLNRMLNELPRVVIQVIQMEVRM